VGFTDIAIAWDQSRSSTGPNTFNVAYSTDGVVFTNALNSYSVQVLTWSSMTTEDDSQFSLSLASIGAVANAPSVTFRLVAASAPSGTAGTNRVDNFTVTGTEVVTTPGVPESGATILLLGLSLAPMAGVAAARRR
jgi:hypothetical protein